MLAPQPHGNSLKYVSVTKIKDLNFAQMVMLGDKHRLRIIDFQALSRIKILTYMVIML
jgi:hypothetical protein